MSVNWRDKPWSAVDPCSHPYDPVALRARLRQERAARGYDPAFADEEVERAVRYAGERHAYLEWLAALFDELTLPADRDAAILGLTATIVRVVDEVAGFTGGEEAWYDDALLAVAWLLESLGIEPDRAADLAARSLGGRFASWVEPEPDTRDAAAMDAAVLALEELRG